MDGSVLYPGFWRFLWGTYDSQKIFWDRGWGSSEPRKFANSRCQRSFHFSNVLWVNILHQVLASYIWSEKLVPQVRISARWGSFDTRKFANSRFQRSFRFSNVPHPTLLIFLTRFSPFLVPTQMDFAGGWGPWGLFKAAWRYFPRVVVESESIALKVNIWQCLRAQSIWGIL